MPTSEQQRTLRFRQADGTLFTFQLPLLGVEGVRSLTSLMDYEIHEAVEDGSLLYAWNVSAVPGAKLLRVWNKSVTAYLNPKVPQPRELAEVLNYLLPTRSQISGALDSAELALILNVSADLVADLFTAGAFTEHPASQRRSASGPNGKRIATRASVEKFFQARRLL
jgi:hypothetical protein